MSTFHGVCFRLQWPYGDICGIGPVGKGQGTEFNLTFRKGSGKKSETLKFSTEHRMELLTEALVSLAVTNRTRTSIMVHTLGTRIITSALQMMSVKPLRYLHVTYTPFWFDA